MSKIERGLKGTEIRTLRKNIIRRKINEEKYRNKKVIKTLIAKNNFLTNLNEETKYTRIIKRRRNLMVRQKKLGIL